MVMPMSKKGIFIVGLLLLALAALAQYTFDWVGVGAQDMRMESTGQGVTYALDANPSFHSNNSRFYFFATRSGIRYTSSGGETRNCWQDSFSLTRPQMVTYGDIVAVSEDDQGRIIHVYNTDGRMYYVTFNNPVRYFSVNGQGDLSVITQSDGIYSIYMIDRRDPTQRRFIFRYHLSDNPMRFPVAVELSEDGSYIAIAYLNLYRHLVTEIEFHFTDGRGLFGTESLFAWTSLPQDEMILTMRFMAGNRLLLVTDSQITLQGVADSGIEEVWAEPLYNRLDQLAFCGNSRFAFVSGAPTSPDGRDADPVGTVNIFDLNGLTGRFYLGRRATHLSMGHNAVIVGADRYFVAVNSRGAMLWQHTVFHDVRDMIFLDNTDTVLIAGPNRADVWRRQRTRNE